MKDVIVVKIFQTRPEAEVAKSFLATNDISSFVTADDEGGANPFLANMLGVKLFVKQKDYKKAVLLLKKNE